MFLCICSITVEGRGRLIILEKHLSSIFEFFDGVIFFSFLYMERLLGDDNFCFSMLWKSGKKGFITAIFDRVVRWRRSPQIFYEPNILLSCLSFCIAGIGKLITRFCCSPRRGDAQYSSKTPPGAWRPHGSRRRRRRRSRSYIIE